MKHKTLFTVLSLTALLWCGEAFAEPQCVNAGINSACGYDCKTAGANVQCAKTPDGACIAVGAQILCWDPPRPTNRKAGCISAGINMACGYDCKSAGANVKCAKTPEGKCNVQGAQINCWDPAPAAQARPKPPKPAPRPQVPSECVNAGINSACGYDCKTAGANAQCAQTKDGACIAVGAQILCWDPPRPTNRKAECISAGINMACGYDCKSAGANVKCSSNPNGKCIVNGANITCAE